MNQRSVPEVSRRTVLKAAALGGVAAFIAACTGTRSSAAPATQAPGASEEPAGSEAPASQAVTGPLMFANWPAYIDLVGAAGDKGEYEPGSSPSLQQFQEQFGVE